MKLLNRRVQLARELGVSARPEHQGVSLSNREICGFSVIPSLIGGPAAGEIEGKTGGIAAARRNDELDHRHEFIQTFRNDASGSCLSCI